MFILGNTHFTKVLVLVSFTLNTNILNNYLKYLSNMLNKYFGALRKHQLVEVHGGG